MEPPFYSETGVPLGEALVSPSFSESSQFALAQAHYLIPPEEITADRDSPLGVGRRNGSVFKGIWNNSLVAIRVLSNDTPLDVSRQMIPTRKSKHLPLWPSNFSCC
jgi:hypothetical protein